MAERKLLRNCNLNHTPFLSNSQKMKNLSKSYLSPNIYSSKKEQIKQFLKTSPVPITTVLSIFCIIMMCSLLLSEVPVGNKPLHICGTASKTDLYLKNSITAWQIINFIII